MNSTEELLFNLIGYAAASGIAAVLLVIHRRHRPYEPFFILPRLRPARWNGFVVLANFVLFQACIYAAILLLLELGLLHYLMPEKLNVTRAEILASPLAYTSFLALSFTLLYQASKTPISKVGFSFARWRAHAALGAIAFLAITPVLLGIYTATLQVFQSVPHPLESMKNEQLTPSEWWLVMLNTVVLAPVVEEWLFRGLLLGWLRRANLVGQTLFLITLLADLAWRGLAAWQSSRGEPAAGEIINSNIASAVFVSTMAAICVLGVLRLYRPIAGRGLAYFIPEGNAENPPETMPDVLSVFDAEGREARTPPWSLFGPKWHEWKHTNARWAIVGSSFAFAAVHPWPSPIPLFVFGLVAGWMTYRTQNLVPAMVMHGLFNLVAFVTLWLAVYTKPIGNDNNVASTSPPGVGTTSVAPGVCWPR